MPLSCEKLEEPKGQSSSIRTRSLSTGAAKEAINFQLPANRVGRGAALKIESEDTQFQATNNACQLRTDSGNEVFNSTLLLPLNLYGF